MSRYLKIPFRELQRKNIVLAQLRERLLKVMLFSSCALGTALYATALIPVLQKDLYSTVFVYSILYIWIILITFMPRLPYRVRAICWLALFYVLGSINLFMSGFNVDAGLFFITFIAMAILLMDLLVGLVALVLGSVTISILGFVDITEHVKLSMGLSQSNSLLWIIGGIVFLLMGVLLIYSLTIVVQGLNDNLSKAILLSEELEQTNQSLRTSEARYRTLMETSPGLVVLFDLNGNILTINQVGLALLGYENSAEMVGKNMSVFITPEDQSRVANAFQRTIQGGPPNDLECHVLRKDGFQFITEFNATLVADEAGKPLSVIAVGKDISERKAAEQILREAKEALAAKVAQKTVQLEQTTSRLNELVKYGPTAIYSYRLSDQAVTYISENVSTLVGYENSDLIVAKNFWDRVHPEDKDHIFAKLEQVRNQERTFYDYRFLHKDGTYRWMHDERVLIRDASGNPLEYLGSWSDITDRKNAEETLKVSEAKYRNLYESMRDAYVSVDMEGRIKEFNQAYENMLGYTSDELKKLTNEDLTPKKWHKFEAGIIEKQVLPIGYSDIYEKEYTRKDGTAFPVELRTKLIRNMAGDPSGMWAIIRDVSEHKRIEQNLRESERRYRELLDNSMQGVIVFQNMRIEYVNNAIMEVLGYNDAELKSFKPVEILQHVHPQDRRMFRDILQRRMINVPTSERYSMRVFHKNGEIRWIEARNVPIELQGKPALMITGIDVSEIRKVEAELLESSKIQRTILNATKALAFLVDTNGILIASNDKFAERMGFKTENVAGISMYDLLPEEVLMARKVPFDQVIGSGKPITFIDTREGTWFENSMYPVQDESGKVVGVAVFARDITEQRKVTEALRSSEEQYRTLAETAHDLIFIINREDCIQYVNSFGAKYLGKEPLELVGQPRARFFPSDTNQHQGDHIQHVFRTGEAYASEDANTFLAHTIWLNTWLVPLKDASGEVTSVLGISRDLTERKIAEQELQRARNLLEERVAERTKELSASQEKLRALTAQTIQAQEEERRSIARELHDDAGQALITLKFGLAAIESALPETHSSASQRLADAMKIIDQTNAHIRSLAHNLRPPVLEIGGIHLGLQDYCREQSERTQIPIYYQGVEISGLPDEIGISLFRFVQEALTNILKHAHATEVKIRLQYKKGEISLSVSDNGRGMDKTLQTDGMGLLGIRERLSLFNGRLEIQSRKGRGAKLVACIPWRQPGGD